MKTSLLSALSLVLVAAYPLRAQIVFTLPNTPIIGQPIVGGSGGTPFVLLQPNAVQTTRVTNGFSPSQTGGVTVGAGQGSTGSTQFGTLPVSTVQTGFFPQGATPLVNLQLQFGTNPLIPTGIPAGTPNGTATGTPSQHVGRGNFPPGTVFPGQSFTGSVGYTVAPSFVPARRRAMTAAEMQYAAQVAAAEVAARRGHGGGGISVRPAAGVGVPTPGVNFSGNIAVAPRVQQGTAAVRPLTQAEIYQFGRNQTLPPNQRATHPPTGIFPVPIIPPRNPSP